MEAVFCRRSALENYEFEYRPSNTCISWLFRHIMKNLIVQKSRKYNSETIPQIKRSRYLDGWIETYTYGEKIFWK